MLIQNAFMFRQKTTSIDRLAFQITNLAVESFLLLLKSHQQYYSAIWPYHNLEIGSPRNGFSCIRS